MVNEEYVAELMENLQKQLNEASKAYYNGMPEVMSDAEFDDKLNLLSALENQYPQYKTPESPTVNVGYGSVLKGLEKVKHPKKMLSLDKRYDIEEIVDFFETMFPVVASLKGDGLTVVLTFQNGILTDAVTRGNGETGDRIIKAARTFANLPAVVDFKGKLVFRAEAVITREMFNRILQDYVDIHGEDDPGKPKNPRNLVSGTVRSHDPNVVAQRKVEAYAFELVSVEPADGDTVPDEVYDSDIAGRKWLESLGIECIEYRLLNNGNDIRQYKEYVNALREQGYLYDTDGIVFCTDSVSEKKRLGATAKYPLYALAFKFPNKGQVSNVTGIAWQAGMYSITPVVSVEPIEFEGVRVQKATAHNLNFVLGRDSDGNVVRPPIIPGCQVKIERSGEVIPKISEVFFDTAEVDADMYNSVSYPLKCPVCGAPTEKRGVELVCSNTHCKGKLKAKIRTMVSKNALNIAGIGDKAIETIVDKGFVKSINDILLLSEHEKELKALEGYGEKKVGRIISEIEKAKQVPLPNVITALCIKGVGLEVARTISSQMSHGLVDILTLQKEQLVSLDGVGEILAENIMNYISDDDCLYYISELINHGYGTVVAKNDRVSDSLSNMTICITGTLSVGRDVMEEYIRKHSGKPTGSVSGKTTYVVVGDAPGKSKTDKALQLNIPMISEDELRKMAES